MLRLLMKFIPGAKTYVVGVGMILTAVGPGLMDLNLSQINTPLLLEGFGLITLRMGVASVGGTP